jgi:type I restriction enzyme S subunit
MNNVFVALATGIRERSCDLRWNKISVLPFVRPSFGVQKKIADFIDMKSEEIDSLIGLQEQMIEKLKAYKQSVITEAVTKGLNPSAKLVSSGVDWIDEIPEGWEVKPFKELFRTGKGLSFTKADLVKEGVPVISYGQVHSKQNTGTRIDDVLIRFVPDEIAKGGESSKVRVGDFIFADTSEDLSGCGNCVYVDKENGLYAGYHSVIAFSKRKDSNIYLAYLFLTDCWRSQIRCRVSGIKVFSISQAIVKQTSIILPPQEEQLSIASYLDEKCADIDHLIELKQQKIEKLKDYKKSVIYEAVTGKINIES